MEDFLWAQLIFILILLVFCVLITMIVCALEGFRKKSNAQQTQIDDLKRELEEMKQKQSEPQS